MKIRITVKDPNGIYHSACDAAAESFNDLELPDDDFAEAVELRAKVVMDALKPWVKYQEYITIEIDTETKRAIVIENREK